MSKWTFTSSPQKYCLFWIQVIFYLSAEALGENTHFLYMTSKCGRQLPVNTSILLSLTPKENLKETRTGDHFFCDLDLVAPQGHRLFVHILQLGISHVVTHSDNLRFFEVLRDQEVSLTPVSGLYGRIDRSYFLFDESAQGVTDYRTRDNVLRIKYLGLPTVEFSGFKIVVTAFLNSFNGGKCQSQFFHCQTASICVHSSALCNDVPNCGIGDLTDENGCDDNRKVTSLLANYSQTRDIFLFIILPLSIFLMLSVAIACIGRKYFLIKCPKPPPPPVLYSSHNGGRVKIRDREELSRLYAPPSYEDLVTSPSQEPPPAYSSLPQVHEVTECSSRSLQSSSENLRRNRDLGKRVIVSGSNSSLEKGSPIVQSRLPRRGIDQWSDTDEDEETKARKRKKGGKSKSSRHKNSDTSPSSSGGMGTSTSSNSQATPSSASNSSIASKGFSSHDVTSSSSNQDILSSNAQSDHFNVPSPIREPNNSYYQNGAELYHNKSDVDQRFKKQKQINGKSNDIPIKCFSNTNNGDPPSYECAASKIPNHFSKQSPKNHSKTNHAETSLSESSAAKYINKETLNPDTIYENINYEQNPNDYPNEGNKINSNEKSNGKKHSSSNERKLARISPALEFTQTENAIMSIREPNHAKNGVSNGVDKRSSDKMTPNVKKLSEEMNALSHSSPEDDDVTADSINPRSKTQMTNVSDVER